MQTIFAVNGDYVAFEGIGKKTIADALKYYPRNTKIVLVGFEVPNRDRKNVKLLEGSKRIDLNLATTNRFHLGHKH